jgi:putative flippase GtrA
VSMAGAFRARRGVRQFVKFGIVGASGTLINFVVFHALVHFGWQWWWAFPVGFLLGGVNNYWWNRHWTFRSRGPAGKEMAQFVGVSALALCVSEPVLWLMDRELPAQLLHRNSVAWLAATAAGMAINFFVNKYWTFRHTHQNEDGAAS